MRSNVYSSRFDHTNRTWCVDSVFHFEVCYSSIVHDCHVVSISMIWNTIQLCLTTTMFVCLHADIAADQYPWMYIATCANRTLHTALPVRRGSDWVALLDLVALWKCIISEFMKIIQINYNNSRRSKRKQVGHNESMAKKQKQSSEDGQHLTKCQACVDYFEYIFVHFNVSDLCLLRDDVFIDLKTYTSCIWRYIGENISFLWLFQICSRRFPTFFRLFLTFSDVLRRLF